jgi:FkbM family methyltransferase
MAKVFIDCGAYKGSMLRHCLKNPAYGPSYKRYAFECNPALRKIDYGADVTVIRKAVWIVDGFVNFYMNLRHPTAVQGHSVYREKTTGGLDKNRPVAVPCIDFSTWLKNEVTADNYVVVKMNIEGAEYDVLEKCVADGTATLIDELHIQWHAKKCLIPEERSAKLRQALAALPIKIFNGYGTIKAPRK